MDMASPRISGRLPDRQAVVEDEPLMRKMRRISGSFWTLERDERLRRLEAEGLSAAKIGEKLGTTRSAVLGRLHRLSGAALTYSSYI
jgi:hypothetical protein